MPYSCCELEVDMSYSIELYIDICKKYVGEDNITIFALGVSVAFVLLAFLIWRLILAAGVKRSGVLFVGISGAGKTCVLSKILTGKDVETVTSLKENQGGFATDNGALNLVDIPGQEAIRQKFFDKFKDTIKGIVFLIDSESFSKDLKDVAEYLFTILTDHEIFKIAPNILIACNKQDLLASKSKKVIQDQLEKELNTVRKTRSAGLSSTDGKYSSIRLGLKGRDFEFSHLGKIKVEFGECNAKHDSEGESRLDDILMWISRLA